MRCTPDGKRIAYRKIIATPGFAWDLSSIERNSEVFVADLDGSNEKNLSTNAAFDGWPMWSPDGQWIVFSSNRAGPANVGHLHVVRPDGTGLAQITHGPSGYAQPSWSPDGRAIYAYRFVETADHESGTIARITFTAP